MRISLDDGESPRVFVILHYEPIFHEHPTNHVFSDKSLSDILLHALRMDVVSSIRRYMEFLTSLDIPYHCCTLD
jgi:hypothetical protein